MKRPPRPNLTAAVWGITFLMLIGLPLAGAALNGLPLKAYLEFPPLTRHLQHARFNPWFFSLYAMIDLMLILGMGYMLKVAYLRSRAAPKRRAATFPAWGWIGLTVMVGGWVLAWTRFEWFAPLQGHTFCIPWIGYIVLVNAICRQRSGKSLLTEATARFLSLFLVSTLFWWFFEYLNRYVQNWYYVGVDEFSPLAYTAFASLAFATVLPAVLSTQRLLLTFRIFDPGLSGFRPWPEIKGRGIGAVTLTAAGLGLALIGIFPDQLFSLVWFAPLLILTALQWWADQPTIFSPLSAGDWRHVVSAALAALVCGFFWEMWNIGSLARWEYAIPMVDRYHLFAMPLVGYGGYLPFGLQCLVIGQMVLGENASG